MHGHRADPVDIGSPYHQRLPQRSNRCIYSFLQLCARINTHALTHIYALTRCARNALAVILEISADHSPEIITLLAGIHCR